MSAVAKTRSRAILRSIVGLGVVSLCGYMILRMRGMPLESWFPNTAMFVATYLILMAIHEFGHLTAGVSLDMRLERAAFIGFGFLVGVGYEDGQIRSNRDQWLVSIGGPVLGIIASAAVLMVSGRLIPLNLAAWIGLGESVANLIIWHHGFDGGKAMRAGLAILHGKGNDPFVPKEPKAKKAKKAEPQPSSEVLA